MGELWEILLEPFQVPPSSQKGFVLVGGLHSVPARSRTEVAVPSSLSVRRLRGLVAHLRAGWVTERRSWNSLLAAVSLRAEAQFDALGIVRALLLSCQAKPSFD